MTIKNELLEIICCPVCKSNLKLDESGDFLICDKCKVKYPIEDDIPILLADKAVSLNENKR